jgi:hypothetical protein
MRYVVQFQHRPRNSTRPVDCAQDFEVDNDKEALLIPQIGDHVQMSEAEGFSGIVENRQFTYITAAGKTSCYINIVLTDSDVDQGCLIKE